MNPDPANPRLFWACFVGGTVGPILGTFLTSFGRRPYNDQAFLLLWLVWLSGTILLILAHGLSAPSCWDEPRKAID
jgi:hypothetical protein